MTDPDLPFWDHVKDLRRTLLLIFFCIFLGMLTTFFFYPKVIDLLTYPFKQSQTVSGSTSLQRTEIRRERITNSGSVTQIYERPNHVDVVLSAKGAQALSSAQYLLPSGSYIEVESIISHAPLILLGPLEGLLIAFKISFWIGLVATSPLWLLCAIRFVMPALYAREVHLVGIFCLLSALFMSAGVFFGWFFSIPLANQYLLNFNETIGTNLWTLSSYLDYTIMMLLCSALAFELGLGLLFLVHTRILSKENMVQKRRHAFLGAFILGALLTPPDILTQVMMALPLIGLYEIAILYAWWREQTCERNV